MVEREERCPKKKAYLRLSTTLGDLNLELHSDMVSLAPFSLSAPCAHVCAPTCSCHHAHLRTCFWTCYLEAWTHASSRASAFFVIDHMTL